MINESSLHAFRRFQVESDLRRLASFGGRPALRVIAEIIPAELSIADQLQDIMRGMLGDDRTVAPAMREDVFHRLLFFAAQPGQDLSAFLTATSLLLLDVLGPHDCPDALDEHWDAFLETYRNQDPVVRSVIVQGFLLGRDMRRVELDPAPDWADGRTDAPEALLVQLKTLSNTTSEAGLRDIAGLLVKAIETQDDNRSAARLWAREGAAIARHKALRAPVVWRGFRHLCEIQPDWDPYQGRAEATKIPIPLSLS